MIIMIFSDDSGRTVRTHFVGLRNNLQKSSCFSFFYIFFYLLWHSLIDDSSIVSLVYESYNHLEGSNLWGIASVIIHNHPYFELSWTMATSKSSNFPRIFHSKSSSSWGTRHGSKPSSFHGIFHETSSCFEDGPSMSGWVLSSGDTCFGPVFLAQVAHGEILGHLGKLGVSRFPEIGGPPVIIPFRRIFPNKNHPMLGTPISGNPQMPWILKINGVVSGKIFTGHHEFSGWKWLKPVIFPTNPLGRWMWGNFCLFFWGLVPECWNFEDAFLAWICWPFFWGFLWMTLAHSSWMMNHMNHGGIMEVSCEVSCEVFWGRWIPFRF